MQLAGWQQCMQVLQHITFLQAATSAGVAVSGRVLSWPGRLDTGRKSHAASEVHRPHKGSLALLCLPYARSTAGYFQTWC